MLDISSTALVRPLYQQVKHHILSGIDDGSLLPGEKVASENELVASLGVSRMTVNRALRELTSEGYIQRVAGVGTFVANRKPVNDLSPVTDIALELQERGKRWSARVLKLCRVSPSGVAQDAFGQDVTRELGFLRVVHASDGTPVMLEERYVNLDLVPEFMDQDFSRQSPTAYLLNVTPLQRITQSYDAVNADRALAEILRLAYGDACLQITRRTQSRGRVASLCQLTYTEGQYQNTEQTKLSWPKKKMRIKFKVGNKP